MGVGKTHFLRRGGEGVCRPVCLEEEKVGPKIRSTWLGWRNVGDKRARWFFDSIECALLHGRIPEWGVCSETPVPSPLSSVCPVLPRVPDTLSQKRRLKGGGICKCLHPARDGSWWGRGSLREMRSRGVGLWEWMRVFSWKQTIRKGVYWLAYPVITHFSLSSGPAGKLCFISLQTYCVKYFLPGIYFSGGREVDLPVFVVVMNQMRSFP